MSLFLLQRKISFISVRLVLVDSVIPRASLMIMNGAQPSLDQGGGGPVSEMRPSPAF
mgnify:CR=1 FL=1